MKPMVMLDVDGVLADMSAFEHLVATNPKQWREFFGHGREAALIPAGAQLAVTLSGSASIWCTPPPGRGGAT